MRDFSKLRKAHVLFRFKLLGKVPKLCNEESYSQMKDSALLLRAVFCR